jgi:hypothetical protein
MNQLNFKAELFTNGHVVLDGSSFIGFFDIANINFKTREYTANKENLPDQNDNLIEKGLSIIHHEIAREFLEPYVEHYSFSSRPMWESSPGHHKLWHSDAAEKDQLFFLLYFTDQVATNDGALRIKVSNKEYRYLPFPGLMIAMENTQTDWMHMVESASSKRVVASLGFRDIIWKN